MNTITRRDFLQTAAAGGVALTILSRPRSAVSANDKLNTAHIGVGGMGGGDLKSISRHPHVNVTALCDIDADKLAAAGKKFPDARQFSDFRVLFDEMADGIDAVIVSTPDHTHAPAAMTALNHAKHVYCQKPLTHDIYEARRLNEVATEKGLVTQMGVQGHASISYRSAVQAIQSGVIGKVREVHAWSYKNWGYDGGPFEESDPVPSHVDWNLWLGTAQNRPFKKGVYHPGNWRKLVDFGTGTLGDMGVHIFDTPYRALKLTAPNNARTTCRPPTNVGHPEKNVVEYTFPGTDFTTDTLRWVWYDGAWAPPQDHGFPLPEGEELPKQGSVFIGSDGVLLLPHGGEWVLLPSKDFADYKRPELEQLNHYDQFVDACLGKTQTSAHFGYGGPLTEALLLGVVANRFPDTTLEWDAAKMQVSNLSEADALLKRSYREGFEVAGL